MKKILVVFFIGIILSGCFTGPPFFLIEKGELRGDGWLRVDGLFLKGEKGGARVDRIEINLAKTPPDVLSTIWVEIRPGEKTSVSLLTPQLLKECGFKEFVEQEGNYYAGDGGISFQSDRNLKFIHVRAAVTPYPSSPDESPRLGSFSTGKSLVLPCSVPELESVFGKPDCVCSYRIN